MRHRRTTYRFGYGAFLITLMDITSHIIECGLLTNMILNAPVNAQNLILMHVCVRIALRVLGGALANDSEDGNDNG